MPLRPLLPAPPSLVNDGWFNFGTYDRPIKDLNALDAAIPRPLPFPLRPPRAYRFLHLKEWHAFQLGNERFFLLIAIMNMKKIGLVKIDVYDIAEGEQYTWEKMVPPWRLALPTTLMRSDTRYHDAEGGICVASRLEEGQIRIAFDIAGKPGRPPLRGAFTGKVGAGDRYEPIVVAIPFAKNAGMYSHKAVAPLSGRLEVGANRTIFEPAHSYFILDDHKGYYPYIMQWDWVVGATHDEMGRLIGFNLTHNQSLDEERYNENAFWYDGALHLLPPVRFHRHDEGDDGEYWLIRDDAGDIELRFDVAVKNPLKVNAIVLESRYRGPYGTFSGTIRSPASDTQLRIDAVFGMGERFYLRC